MKLQNQSKEVQSQSLLVLNKTIYDFLKSKNNELSQKTALNSRKHRPIKNYLKFA